MSNSAWQPIETAPKGEPVELVLLYDAKKGGVSIGAWWGHGWSRYIGCAKLKPTHWMPLPPAPKP